MIHLEFEGGFVCIIFRAFNKLKNARAGKLERCCCSEWTNRPGLRFVEIQSRSRKTKGARLFSNGLRNYGKKKVNSTCLVGRAGPTKEFYNYMRTKPTRLGHLRKDERRRGVILWPAGTFSDRTLDFVGSSVDYDGLCWREGIEPGLQTKDEERYVDSLYLWKVWVQSQAHTQGPFHLVVRTPRCGRDNPGSTPGEDMYFIHANTWLSRVHCKIYGGL